MTTLDVITIGRSSVDLYGVQVGGRLEDMGSFDKYIGGSPTNTACGASRLGLRAAVITKVGDEHMGRFVREQLVREGVDVRGVKTDPKRLTALVILGIRDQEQFPLIFYRDNCADMALSEDDIDPDFIVEARAVVASGTHLSHPNTEAATLKALNLARQNGARTALDIDYRPNLWGLAGFGEGENRFIESARGHREAAIDAATVRPDRRHRGGIPHCRRHDRYGRRPQGCAGGDGRRPGVQTRRCRGDGLCWRHSPTISTTARADPVSPIEVFNVLGAGDGFMGGLLKGWLDDEPWPVALKYANACGAIAVSRHGCTPAYPSWEELQFFFARGIVRPDLRHDAELEQVHWSTNRSGDWPDLRVFAFDHRMQLEEMDGYAPDRGGRFKQLCLDAALRVQDGKTGYGILCDNRIGRTALWTASGTGLWIGRPVEKPGSRPLELEPELGPDCGQLGEWARENVVKLLCFCHPDDDDALWAEQIATITRLFTAARRNTLEVLLEVIPSKVGPVEDDTTARVITRLYQAGIFPDWWKLEPMVTEAAWRNAIAAIEAHDNHTRGIVVLGLDAPVAQLSESFERAARFDLVKGFAVGRTIFGDVARAWFAGTMGDEEAVATMAEKYTNLCTIWDSARRAARGEGKAQ